MREIKLSSNFKTSLKRVENKGEGTKSKEKRGGQRRGMVIPFSLYGFFYRLKQGEKEMIRHYVCVCVCVYIYIYNLISQR